MANEEPKEKTPDPICAACGKPITSGREGGLNYAKIAHILGADAVYHVGCHPKGQKMAQMGFRRR